MYISVVAVSLKKIFFKQKTAYAMTLGDWSSDVCSSDLGVSGNLWIVVKDVKTLVVYDVE